MLGGEQALGDGKVAFDLGILVAAMLARFVALGEEQHDGIVGASARYIEGVRDGFLTVADDLMINAGRGVGGELRTDILDALVRRILFRIDDKVRIFARNTR